MRDYQLLKLKTKKHWICIYYVTKLIIQNLDSDFAFFSTDLKIGDMIYFKSNDYQSLVFNVAESMCGSDQSSDYCKDLYAEMKLLQEVYKSLNIY